jgi:hypothetical protein
MRHTTSKADRSEGDFFGDDSTPAEGGSPIGPDTVEAGPASGVQANGQPASNGRGDRAAHVPVSGAEQDADAYNLDSLRLSQNFAAAAGVRKIITTIPVRKPSREAFARVHPDPAYRIDTLVLELKEERETYLIASPLQTELVAEPTVSSRRLVTAITRQRVLFVWPIRLPGTDGRLDDWSRSMMEAAERAQTHWVRVTANMHLGAYDIAEAPGQMTEPEWPDLSFQQIIRIAFKDRMIDTWEHPILRRLRGES